MNILFLGGDLRQKYASDYLQNNNYNSKIYLDFNIENIKSEIINAYAIALPVPVSSDGMHLKMQQNSVLLNDIIEILDKNTIIFGGKFPSQLKRNLINDGRIIIDYMDIEPFQIRNALLSAEGAIYYAKQKFEKSIHGASIAILGCGRIGKILAYLLRSQGAAVTVIARRDIHLVWSKLIGYDTIKISGRGKFSLKKHDIIFNTIPYHIMDEDFASLIDKSTLIIDLASFPYGIDDKLVDKYSLKYFRELGIPGRYAPKSAGEIIGQTIINNIFTREDSN